MEKLKPNLVDPQTDEDFFAIGRLLLSRSTCLKTQTAALIVKDGKVISWGVNMCCPQGQLYGLPVSECPRMDKTTGTHYELCMPIHAEIVATINAFGMSHVDRKSLWHFPGFTLKLKHYEGFFKNKAALYLLGHYWACEECVAFLKLVGITEIKFDDLSGKRTLKDYARKSLVGETQGIDVATCLEGVVTISLERRSVEEFCLRNNIGKDSIVFVPQSSTEENLLCVVAVEKGKERETSGFFSKDPAVKESKIVFLH